MQNTGQILKTIPILLDVDVNIFKSHSFGQYEYLPLLVVNICLLKYRTIRQKMPNLLDEL